jgi:hypothetical protein
VVAAGVTAHKAVAAREVEQLGAGAVRAMGVDGRAALANRLAGGAVMHPLVAGKIKSDTDRKQ